MKIFEQFIKGKKNNQALCEDMLFVNEYFIAVVDGVTTKTDALFDGKTGGRAAAEKICEAIGGFSEDTALEKAVDILSDSVKSLYYDGAPYGSAAAGVIIYSNFHKEIWSIGDCQCYVNDEFFSHGKEIDSIVSDMRALVLEMSRREGVSDKELSEKDPGRELILPVIKKQQMFANSGGRFSYGVINGSKVLRKDMVVHKVQAGDEIVLASDGYPKLMRTLKESEKILEEELKNNPLCYKDFRSTKGVQKDCLSFDDRTYIKFRVD
ncbi:MAG: hypothetical protein J6D06_11425 [Clostridia bacterium]|nr:hypothetical protein [Clostridia bacterium]